ncbi:LysR substrate-binding domain-containing protein [Pseudomarimonas salicorniae]|uniref:LysR substrate-binding domain-containing protein n=1 Tax=Pseudomarimonas salicorniae TaxID=2933270 RepID=A0ABT0GI74_9GAMM|nr:LysR substrate-binding domain-containing protein [Lysobacter sp. CAU 1642]MCK7594235.1 LysR substrate-binding domain-containing protein [Lysobacter sp. CAU 1642]
MSLRGDWLVPLTAFEAAARHQNFARAAEELHLTASAVSHHVRRLEQRLGLSLFQRHARGVTLTAEGRRLADAAGSAFADVAAALRGLRGERKARPPLRITTLHSFAQGWLVPRLAGFRERHPGIRLRIETEAALTRFDDSGPDLGIRHGGGQWPGLQAQLLLDETLFAVASPALIEGQRIATVEQVAAMPLIADLSRQGWPDWMRAAGLGHLDAIEALVFSDSTDAFRAAACGLGAALARERIVQPWLQRGDLARLPGPVLPGRFSYYLVYPEAVRLGDDAQQFIAWLLETVREAAVT